MSKFKVTLRRNGSAVGEMHYGSEAVAVTKAKAMKDATGCDVTVAPVKANRRRAVTRRRNPESTTLWTVRVGSQEIGEFHAPSRLTAAIAREAAKVAAEQGYTASYFKRWGSVSDGLHRHPVAQFLKNGHRCNPSCGCPKSNRRRRNGTTAGEAAASRSLAHRAAMILGS